MDTSVTLLFVSDGALTQLYYEYSLVTTEATPAKKIVVIIQYTLTLRYRSHPGFFIPNNTFVSSFFLFLAPLAPEVSPLAGRASK